MAIGTTMDGSCRNGNSVHLEIGTQCGDDPERLEQVLKRFETVQCVMEPGDGLFFHGCTLHGSGPNVSHVTRDVIVTSYNTRRNNPHKEAMHPRYLP